MLCHGRLSKEIILFTTQSVFSYAGLYVDRLYAKPPNLSLRLHNLVNVQNRVFYAFHCV